MCCSSHDPHRAGVIHLPQCSTRWIVCSLLASLLVLTIPQFADCGVDVLGNVTPIDNPFTYPENEGIPASGNSIDEDREKDDQPTLEGVYSWNSDSNSVPTITVGEYAYGMVQVLAPSQLNFGDLIIGSSANNFYGNGIVKISGLGATYNSDFEIFDQQLAAMLPEPDPLPAPDPGEVVETINTIRSGLHESGGSTGFDLTVGETGTGTLLIASGGRAEIHDSIIVGDEIGSNGEITVDGFASYLHGGGTFSVPLFLDNCCRSPHHCDRSARVRYTQHHQWCQRILGSKF